MIVAALTSAWATEHDRPGTGKRVWAELRLDDPPDGQSETEE